MVSAKQCDRCKEFYKDEDTSALPYDVKATDGEDRDLCLKCKYDLEEFMDNFTGRGKKRKKHVLSAESHEKMSKQMAQRQEIAKLIQEGSNDMEWKEAVQKASMRIRKAKEQGVTLEELKDTIERSIKHNDGRGNKKPLCPMCGKNKVDNEGDMCDKCTEEWNEYQRNK